MRPLLIAIINAATQAILLAICTATALAQGVHDSPHAELIRGDIGRITRGNDLTYDYARMMAWDLRLDAEQRAAVMDLYEGFRSQWLEAEDKMLAYSEAFKAHMAGGKNPELEQEYNDTWTRFSDYRARIRARLEEDIKLLLKDEQLARWSIVERSAARFSLLRNTPGEPIAKIDLARLAERATRRDGASPELIELADRYALDMHRAAEDYKKWWEEWWPRRAERQRPGDPNPNQTESDLRQREQRRFMVRVGDINESYVHRFGQLMTPEQRDAFIKEFLLLAVDGGWMRRDQRLDIPDIVQRVRQIPDLSPEARSEFERLVGEYERDLLNYRMSRVKVVREHERELLEMEDPGEVLRARSNAVRQRFDGGVKDLAQKLIRDTRELLTEEQIESMPPPLGQRSLVPPVFE